MKKIIKKSINRDKTNLQKRLEDYSLLSKGFINSYLETGELKSSLQGGGLGAFIALAATAMSPTIVNGQCVVYGSGIDLDGDMEADVYVSYYFGNDGYTNGNCFHSEQIYQIRVIGAPGANVTFYGTGAGIPRQCYVNNCLFPYDNGATTAPSTGSVGVLFSSVNSCNFCTVSTQICTTNCSTYSTPSGTTMMCTTNCYTTFYTTTDCEDPTSNGNFPPFYTGTLAIKLNGTFYFTEIEVLGSPMIITVNGVTAQQCDPDGCLDTVSIVGNQAIPGQLYRAEHLIESDGIVQAGDSVTFKSGGEIDLMEDFRVDSNATFLAEIETCPTSLSSVPPAAPPQLSLELDQDICAIKWEQKDSYGVYGFEIQRSIGPDNFRKIGWVDLDASNPTYVFEDDNLKPNTRYLYRIKQIHVDGASVYSGREVIQLRKDDLFTISDIHVDGREVTLDINSTIKRKMTVELFDRKGKIITAYSDQVQNELNHLNFEVVPKESGIHYAKIRVGNKVQYKSLNLQTDN